MREDIFELDLGDCEAVSGGSAYVIISGATEQPEEDGDNRGGSITLSGG